MSSHSVSKIFGIPEHSFVSSIQLPEEIAVSFSWAKTERITTIYSSYHFVGSFFMGTQFLLQPKCSGMKWNLAQVSKLE